MANKNVKLKDKSGNYLLPVTEIGNVNGLQDVLNGKASSSHTHSTSIATSTGTSQISLEAGGKYSLTAGGTSYIFTMPTTTSSHRPIQMNGTEILGNNTNPLNLKAGSNVTLSNSSGTVTISSTDTDTKNTAGATNTTSKIYLVGATSQAANPQTYSNSSVYAADGWLGCLGLTAGGYVTYPITTVNPSGATTLLRGLTINHIENGQSVATKYKVAPVDGVYYEEIVEGYTVTIHDDRWDSTASVYDGTSSAGTYLGSTGSQDLTVLVTSGHLYMEMSSGYWSRAVTATSGIIVTDGGTSGDTTATLSVGANGTVSIWTHE